MGPASRQQGNHSLVIQETESAAKPPPIVAAWDRIQYGMADKRTPYARFFIEGLLKREYDQDMIDPLFDPTNPPRRPRPNLRRDVVHHPQAGRLGKIRKAHVETRMVDKHHRVPLF